MPQPQPPIEAHISGLRYVPMPDADDARAQFMTWLEDEGDILFARPAGAEHWIGLRNFGFTTAILLGQIGDHTGINDRWCYHSAAAAYRALAEWDGTGEPAGWHRHPGTGRRLAEELGCVDEDGAEVEIGTIYVRW